MAKAQPSLTALEMKKSIIKLEAELATLREALHRAFLDFREIESHSPNWMMPNAVANSERYKSDLARDARERADAALVSVENI